MRIKFQGPTTESACFLCPKTIAVGEDAVLWRGAWVGHWPILLHPRCAAMLGERLVRDAAEVDMAHLDTAVVLLQEHKRTEEWAASPSGKKFMAEQDEKEGHDGEYEGIRTDGR